MPLVSSSTSNLMANLLGSLPQGQRMGFAGTLAAGLAAGNQTVHNQQVMSNAQKEAQQRSRELELKLLEYQADTLAMGGEMARKRKEAGELRGKIPEQYRELFDVDQDRALEMSFQKPLSPYEKASLAQGDRSEDRLNRTLEHNISNDDRTGDRADASLQRDLTKDEYQAALDLLAQERAAAGERRAQEAHEAEMNEPDEFTQTVQRVLAANPELQGSQEGIQRAMNVALGTIQTNTDPVQGGTMNQNIATNAGTPVSVPQPPAQRLPEATDDTGQAVPPISVEDMAGEVGAWAWAEDAVGKTLGQVDPSVVDQARVQAATQIDFIKQKALVALSSSARPLASESKRIESLFPSKGIYDSAARAQAQMKHLRNMAVKTHNDYATMIESGSLPHQQRAELRQKQFEIRSLIELLPTDEKFKPAAPSAAPASAPATGGTGAVGTTPDQITDPDPLGLR